MTLVLDSLSYHAIPCHNITVTTGIRIMLSSHVNALIHHVLKYSKNIHTCIHTHTHTRTPTHTHTHTLTNTHILIYPPCLTCQLHRQFLYTYFSSSASPPSDKLQAVTTQKYLNALKGGDNVALTRGSAMAMGVLPVRYVRALL